MQFVFRAYSRIAFYRDNTDSWLTTCPCLLTTHTIHRCTAFYNSFLRRTELIVPLTLLKFAVLPPAFTSVALMFIHYTAHSLFADF